LDFAEGLLNSDGHWFRRAGAERMAAPARAEPRTLGGVRCGEEDYLFTARAACGTGGPAINSGGTDGKKEGAIACAVPAKDGAPTVGFGFFCSTDSHWFGAATFCRARLNYENWADASIRILQPNRNGDERDDLATIGRK